MERAVKLSGPHKRYAFRCPECGERSPWRDTERSALEKARTWTQNPGTPRVPVVCPYWERTEKGGLTLVCEAPVGAKESSTTFWTEGALRQHMSRLCRSWDYMQCPIARVIAEKYNEPRE